MVVKSIISLSIVASFAVHAEEFASKTYKFPPQQPVNIENPLPWGLDTRCAMSAERESVLLGTMKKKKGVINGRTLKQGETTSMNINNNDTLHILADVGAKIEIVNTGVSLVTATCRL